MGKKRKLRLTNPVLPPPRPSCRLRWSGPIPKESDEAPATPVYLVVEHEVEKPAYSLFKVDSVGSDGPGAGDGSPARLPGHLARLHQAKHGMSFVAVNSQHGSWIVGVGGAPGSWGRDTVIYDLKTSKEIRGPCLESAKSQPVLLALRDKVYAISRRPAVKPGDESEPWFEVLDLTEDYPCLPGSTEWSGSWKPLLQPPCFPCFLTPMEYNDPPEVCVTSYAVDGSGSHILVSLDPGNGTYAFDVEEEVWEKVQYNDLPFIGQAVPLIGRLFVSHSKKTNALTFYDMKIHLPTGPTGRMLYIVELAVVASEPIAPCQFFCSLGKGSCFCSFSVPSIDSGEEAKLERHIVRHNYLMDDATLFGFEPEVVMAKQWRQVYKVFDRSRQLAHPTPLVAALTL